MKHNTRIDVLFHLVHHGNSQDGSTKVSKDMRGVLCRHARLEADLHEVSRLYPQGSSEYDAAVAQVLLSV